MCFAPIGRNYAGGAGVCVCVCVCVVDVSICNRTDAILILDHSGCNDWERS